MEGCNERASVSLVAGTCHSGRTISNLCTVGPVISKNFPRHLKASGIVIAPDPCLAWESHIITISDRNILT